MRAYKRLSKNTTMALFAAGLISTGAVASIGAQSFAQTPNANSTTSSHARGLINFMDDDDTVALPEGGITAAQATETVTTAYPNLTIKHMKLEDENGAVVYSVKLSDDTEAIVDAMTGAVSIETEEQETTEQQGRKHHDEATDTKSR